MNTFLKIKSLRVLSAAVVELIADGGTTYWAMLEETNAAKRIQIVKRGSLILFSWRKRCFV